ncbi:acetone carboxylase [Nocardioides sp. R-C-SC26]|uniref:acetone carboxylase n=1 Tax=Nocardioides sp. R-C-SC26 TaxID=2870414 RepID=UPI001E636DF5|nr:acetone carboxylase [Nocardioides sp. R-C-SC26]
MSPDICSAKGCNTAAEHQLLWNNPKLHTPDRRKVWLACEEHRESLSGFLGARQFLKDVVPHRPGESDEPSA